MNEARLYSIASSIARSGSTSHIRVAGKIEFVKDTGPVRRDVRVEGFEWSPDALRNLSKILWEAQRSHSYAVAALRLFSKMPSSQFSPDGLLGGRGYIQSIKDMRSSVSSAVEVLSAFTDTVYDEVNADHWSAVDSGSEKIVEDSEKVKEDPEGFVEQEFQDEEGESDFEGSSPEGLNPTPGEFGQPEEEEDEEDEEDGDEGFPRTSAVTPSADKSPKFDDSDILDSVNTSQEEDDDAGSRLPTDGNDQDFGLTTPEMTMNTTRPAHGNLASSGFSAALDSLMKSIAGAARQASSSVPAGDTPRPVVEHIGPGMTEYGWVNDPSAVPSDDPSMEGIYQFDPILEDGATDGVTGDDSPTEGDSSTLKTAAEAQYYSWLPGSRNEKNLGYYERGLSDADIEWMRQNSDPDDPMAPAVDRRPDTSWMWGKH
jgi:hypothetical protein